MRGSSTHHHRRERVLRFALTLERALDPRGPRFEDVGLRSNGGGKVQLKGERVRPIADAAAKCGIGFEAGCKISGLRRTFEAGVCRAVKVAFDFDAHDPGLTQRTHSHFGCGSRGNHLGDRVGSPGFTQ